LPSLLTKAGFSAKATKLLLSGNRDATLEKSKVNQLDLRFEGIVGDFHAGLTRKSDSRTLKQYPRNTDIRNVRQVTMVSEEELAEIAAAMGIPEAKAEWLGANLVTSGIPDLTLLTPSSRLQFPSGATLVVDMENHPCRQVADVILQHHPDVTVGFVRAAWNKRGLTAWVEREGMISIGDAITVWVPQQRIYPHVTT
jgi:MOSC domain